MQPYLALLAMLPTSYFTASFVGIPVKLKKGQLYPILVTVISAVGWILNHVIFSQNVIVADYWIYFVIYLLLFLFSPKGQRFNAFLVQTILQITQIIGVFFITITIVPLIASTGYTMEQMMDPYCPIYAVACLITSLILCPVLYGCTLLIRKKLPLIHHPGGLSFFLVVPITQMMLVNALMQYAYDYIENHGLRLLPPDVIFVMFLSLGADIAYLLLYRKFHADEQTRIAAQQAEQQLELQNQYYRQMQDSILAVNQIRHDLNNQLQAAYHLLRQGQNRQAEVQLDALNSSLQNRVGTRYCENMMVDAVLCDKAERCQSLGIGLTLSVFLPAVLPMENAQLCSLFANLLDNAIAAVQALGSGDITLRAELQGRMLTVFCRNPSLPPKHKNARQDLLRRHGLGLEILSRIADSHGGHVDASYQDGFFETAVILHLPDDPA